ncbi:hypothetical protein BDN71DRAFT_1441127 [Pleurotus eryngii]|uniref:Uncharacterized protein n=1 Tax=Pleurotus eryngii TaxID=5323 RepID=A0A9P6A6S4_PLEER|nr:hypothetical protein BDN71DRAFT_1441127 [Pleurotus eryngii]
MPQAFAAPTHANGLNGGGQTSMETDSPQQHTSMLDPATGETVTPPKRKPGRPKGSGKKHFLTTDEPKVKRPVGRPRKDGLPAGSLGVIRRSRRSSGDGTVEPISAPQGFTQWRNVSTDAVDDQQQSTSKRAATFAVEHTLEADDWAELLRTKPNAFLQNLLSSLSAPNPISTVGPSVEEAFKSNLVSLSSPQAKGSQSIPSLYSILKTFWLPSSPAYFSLTASASTARTPPEHRFLYWDPQPLVFNGISCPICSYPMLNKGRIRSGPIKVYDLDKPFFIIGCEYVCKSAPCVAATNSDGRKFASTDPSILRSLPAKLKDEFPARLLQGENDSGSGPLIWSWKDMGVSTALWNMVKGAMKLGLPKDTIIRLIRSIQAGIADETPQREEEEDAEAEHFEEEVVNSTDIMMVEQPLEVDKSALDESYADAWRANAAMVAATPVTTNATLEPERTLNSTPTPAPTLAPAPSLTPANTLTTPSTTVSPPATSLTPITTKSPPPVNAPNTMPPTQIQPYGFIPNTGFSSFPLAYAQYEYFTAAAANNILSHPHAHSHSPNGASTQSTSTLHTQSQQSQAQASPSQQPQAQPQTSTTNLMTIGANPLKRPYTAFIQDHQQPDGVNGNGSASVGPSGSTTTPGLEPVSKRAPRHCCKCGSQDCKGKGGRSFCLNPCQDCGKLDCKGRNSRRPDKRCAEAWS